MVTFTEKLSKDEIFSGRATCLKAIQRFERELAEKPQGLQVVYEGTDTDKKED